MAFSPHSCHFQRIGLMALPLLLTILHLCCSAVGWMAGSDSDKCNCSLTAYRKKDHLINWRVEILHFFQYQATPCGTFSKLCLKHLPGHITADATLALLSRMMDQDKIFWYSCSLFDSRCFRDLSSLKWGERAKDNRRTRELFKTLLEASQSFLLIVKSSRWYQLCGAYSIT